MPGLKDTASTCWSGAGPMATSLRTQPNSRRLPMRRQVLSRTCASHAEPWTEPAMVCRDPCCQGFLFEILSGSHISPADQASRRHAITNLPDSPGHRGVFPPFHPWGTGRPVVALCEKARKPARLAKCRGKYKNRSVQIQYISSPRLI